MQQITIQPAEHIPTVPTQRIAFYSRHSSEEDFQKRRKECMQLMEDNPEWRLTGFYSDEKGVNHRSALREMMSDAESGKIDMVVTSNFSQLSRNVVDGMKIINGFRELPNPIGVQILDLGMNTLDEKFDMIATMFAMLGQEEHFSSRK